jgi:hypothetical protein
MMGDVEKGNFTSLSVKIIIGPLDEGANQESSARMGAFEQTGFVQEVLADETEDVWNDL